VATNDKKTPNIMPKFQTPQKGVQRQIREKCKGKIEQDSFLVCVVVVCQQTLKYKNRF
jgi:hypothetical protein